MEDFVDFEIAKKLKEKGYPQHITEGAYIPLVPDYMDDIAAPTISQVLKWLREEKEIYIVIQPFPTMATKNKICWSWDFKWNSDGAYIEHTSPDYVTYTTYEQAALAGIEYVLNNLI